MVTQIQIQPDVDNSFLDDPGTDPFVQGTLASNIPDAIVDAEVYGRICQFPTDPLDDDSPASLLIDTSKKWAVDLYWKLSGPLVPAISGSWSPKLFLESLGEDTLDCEIVTPQAIPFGCDAFGGDRNSRAYHARYTVPAGAVQVESPQGTPFQVSVALIYLTPCDSLPGALVGFVDLEEVLIYKEVFPDVSSSARAARMAAMAH